MGVYEVLPPSIQTIMQNGLLNRAFEDALVPEFLFDAILDEEPWAGGIGSTSVRTKGGLLSVSTTPITGSDASADTYGFEQYTIRQEQYGKSIDTNMMVSAMTLASKFMEDGIKLAINAAQTKNRLARNALYNVYGTGTTFATTTGGSSTSLVVDNAAGFAYATGVDATTGSNPGEGDTGSATPVLVPVSSSNPITVTLGASTANTVTGVNLATNTLTLGTAYAATAGDSVVNNSNGAVSYRPNSRRSAYQITSSDLATLALFQSAHVRLKKQNVPMLNGAYTAHIDAVTLEELFIDPQFENAYRGRADSSAYRDFKLGDSLGNEGEFLGRFSGFDWFVNNELPNTNPTGSLPVYRCIVMGKGAAIRSPFSEMQRLLSELPQNASGAVQIDSFPGGTYRVIRSPLDRLGQIVSQTWAWIGGYSAQTDLLTGDSAAYKRAVVVEHA
jgi:hypothetical protein